MIESDDRLVTKTKAGDKYAFGKLVQRYQQRILYLAFDLIGNYEEAKDIAQESFIRAFEKIEQFEERAQFSTWLFRITVNLALDKKRRNKKTPMQSFDEKFQSGNQNEINAVTLAELPVEKNIERIELRKQLEVALEKLSINQRTATVLKFFHQKTSKEIAEIMGCAESTVRIHIFRALTNLKGILVNFE